MLSRVANSVYWMSRYVERAENVARYIDVNQHLSLDSPANTPQQWEALVTTTGDHEAFKARYAVADRASVIEFLAFDKENPNSILACLTQARENARMVRPTLSNETWEYINRAYLAVRAPGAREQAREATYEFCLRVRELVGLFVSATDGSMARGEAWQFLHLGRMLERADQTSRIVDVKYYILLPSAADVGTPLDTLQWAAMLKSVSGFEMYRQSYGRITPSDVSQFLILDARFPRAIRFCVDAAEQSMHAITGSPPGSFRNDAERQLGRLRSRLDYTAIEEVLQAGMHEYLDDFQGRLNRIDVAIGKAFFQIKAEQERATAEDRTRGAAAS